jgi:hypothetical protein
MQYDDGLPGLSFTNSRDPFWDDCCERSAEHKLAWAELAEIGWRMRVPFNDTRTEVFYLGLTQDSCIHIGGGSPIYFFNGGVGDSSMGSATANTA